ncbi:MAG: glutamate-cysteine ligase family protein [Acidobacteriota bacterium]
MMKKTATIQASFDYGGAADAMRKLRVGLLFTPVLIALTANSPYADGRFTGFLSHRTAIWEETDPARSGRLDVALDPAFDLRRYVSHLLDLPVLFVRRGDRWHAPPDLTFRAFLERGWNGERATMYDWEMHLSTFFPDVRVKTVVEIRGADCPPRRLFMPVIAWMTGILSSPAALATVEDLLGGLQPAQHRDLQRAAAREGLRGSAHGISLQGAARELCQAARRGLAERARLVGLDESALLDPLDRLVERGASPAQDLLDRFGEQVDDPAELVRATSLC